MQLEMANSFDVEGFVFPAQPEHWLKYCHASYHHDPECRLFHPKDCHILIGYWLPRADKTRLVSKVLSKELQSWGLGLHRT